MSDRSSDVISSPIWRTSVSRLSFPVRLCSIFMCASERTSRTIVGASGRSVSASSYRTTRFLPCAFAVIMAASAHAASSRGFIACSGPSEIPTETVTLPTPGGSSSPSRSTMRPATCAASVPSHAPMITPNSSPPSRQTTSSGRTVPRTVSANSFSSSSPMPWPCTSLTRLKSSMSIIRTATGRCVRLVSWSACSRRSWKLRWLKRPVSESVCAWCSSRARICALSSASAAASAKRFASSNSSSLKPTLAPARYRLKTPLICARATSGIEMSASGSSGVPGIVLTRESRWAWLRSTGSRRRAAQPVTPSSKRTRFRMTSSAHRSRARTGMRIPWPSSAS